MIPVLVILSSNFPIFKAPSLLGGQSLTPSFYPGWSGTRKTFASFSVHGEENPINPISKLLVNPSYKISLTGDPIVHPLSLVLPCCP